MSVVQLKDANGTSYYFKTTGDGSIGDPFVPLSNLSVAGVDVSPDNPLPVSNDQIDELLTAISKLTQAVQYPGYLDRSANQIRAQVSGAVTVSAITTLSTLTNMSAIDNYQGALLMRGTSYNAWANTVRRTIT